MDSLLLWINTAPTVHRSALTIAIHARLPEEHVLYVLGTGKAALMPFHGWLPAAMVAPTPVFALLHAVAVVKAGVFTILKVSVYIFGLDLIRELATASWLAYLAGSTILIASLMALTKDNLKARLAYSTVSQLGYIVFSTLSLFPCGRSSPRRPTSPTGRGCRRPPWPVCWPSG